MPNGIIQRRWCWADHICCIKHFRPPQAPDYAGNPSSSSPTYSITARGNRYRPGEPRTEIFGKVRTYPTYLIRPYTRFINNEQYLYEVFHVAEGTTSESGYKIGNSEMGAADDGFILTNHHDLNQNNVWRHTDFLRIKHIVENAQRELYAPNQKPKPPKTNYYGVEKHTAITGGVSHDLELDLVAPNGLANSADIRIHYKGSGIRAESKYRSSSSAPQNAKYIDITVQGDGRNAVRVSVELTILGNTPTSICFERIDNKDSNPNADVIYLVGLRKILGHLPVGRWGEVILLRTKASQISQEARGKFSVIAHNRLPPFDQPNATPIFV